MELKIQYKILKLRDHVDDFIFKGDTCPSNHRYFISGVVITSIYGYYCLISNYLR